MTLFQSRGVFFCVPESLRARLHGFWPVSLSLAVSLENVLPPRQVLRGFRTSNLGKPSGTGQGDTVYITSGRVL